MSNDLKCDNQEQDTGTPRFPSIEVTHKNIGASQKEGKQHINKNRLTINDELTFSFEMKSIKTVNQASKTTNAKTKNKAHRINAAQTLKNKQQEKEVASVKSVQSLRQRFSSRASNKTMADIKKRLSSHHGRSLSTLIQQKINSIEHSGEKKNSQTSYKTIQPKQKQRQLFSSSKKGKSTSNNSSASKPELPKTDGPTSQFTVFDQLSLIQSKEKKLVGFQSQRGKSYKALFQKVRPVLHFNTRLFNNERIEQIVNEVSQFEK